MRVVSIVAHFKGFSTKVACERSVSAILLKKFTKKSSVTLKLSMKGKMLHKKTNQ